MPLPPSRSPLVCRGPSSQTSCLCWPSRWRTSRTSASSIVSLAQERASAPSDTPTSGACSVTAPSCHSYLLPFSLSLSSSRICTQMPGVWQETSDCEATLLPLVHSIVVYCLDHSSESEAADLLMEIDHVALLKDLVKEDTYQRVCLYLTRWVDRGGAWLP